MRCPKCGQELKLVSAEGSEPSKRPSITEVEVTLGEHAKLVEFSQAGTNGAVVVKPKGYLKNDFGKVADKLKPFGARYISEGKNSRWEI